MEHASHVDSTPADDLATRNRFESFKFGKSLSSQLSGPKQRHARSHSRNHSFSSSVSSLSISTSRPASMKLSAPSSNDLSTFTFPRNDPPTASSSSPILNPASKRNSHHRRKSSVSTRRESAELMGISLPDLPQCSFENNINLGEKDSIRRRALWALEGKPDLSTPKVEIPELSTPDIEKLMLDLSTSKSFSAGSSTSFGSSLGSGKRDSFKLLAPSSSNKDQLGTLVEEEEEEEDEDGRLSHLDDVKALDFFPASSSSAAESDAEILPVPVAPVVAVTKPTPARPRPATLNLRPLSLTPESLISSVQGLPTPSPTPSPRVGLKTLTLASISDDSSWTTSKCNSSAVSPSSSTRRPSLNLDTRRSESPTGTEPPVRRSSISYRSSNYAMTSLAGLPTPEMTPTFVKDRFSSGAESISSPTDEGFFPSPPATQFTRPLSASEQHFLFKSHNALLARITDLERTLSMQRRRSSGGVSFSAASRRESVISISTDNSDLGGVEPDDEMLRLISDLKAERDELKRDVDGWRNRVGDMEKQLGIVTKRIETERRDAWVARSRVGLLDAEKSVLEKRLASVERLVQDLEDDKHSLESGNRTILKASEEKDMEIRELRKQLALAEEELVRERALRKQAELEAVTAVTRAMANTMRKRASAVASFDSSSSSTDVETESADNSFNKFGFSLNPVQEEEGDDFGDDNDNDLAGYEDEEDDDEDIIGSSASASSSFDSMDHFPRPAAHLQFGAPTTPPSQSFGGAKAVLVSRSASPDTTADTSLSSSSSTSSSPPPPHGLSSHSRRASLSKTWAFPKNGVVHVSERSVEEDNVDKFFGCLEDSDGNDISNLSYSYERSKSFFASGFKYGNTQEDDAPFFLPGNVGTVVEKEADIHQHVVNEEDGGADEPGVHDGNEMFGEASGITITFTPPEEDDAVEQEELGSETQVVPAMPTADLPPVLPDLKFDDSDEDEDCVVPFSFGRVLKSSSRSASEDDNSLSDWELSSSCFQANKVPLGNVPSLPQSPPPRSAIPRSINLRLATDVLNSSPPPRCSPPSNACISIISKPSTAQVTPPARRGGSSPSFIPQAVSSPSPIRVAPPSIPKARSVPISTFIRQPQRKPPMDAGSVRNLNGVGVSVANVNSSMNVRSLYRSGSDSATIGEQTSEIKNTGLSRTSYQVPFPLQNSVSTPEKMHVSGHLTGDTSFSVFSSPVSSRLSLQKLTNFIPLSWNPIASSSSGSCADSVDSGLRARVNERRYVSREKQLERLRHRLESEGKISMQDSVRMQCKNCVGHGFVEL